jgi:hypothetical protein
MASLVRLALPLALLVAACSDDPSATNPPNDSGTNPPNDSGTTPPPFDAGTVIPPTSNGNPNGKCPVPAAALAEDVSKPTTVVGDGTPASCTGQKVVDAVHAGGVVTFDCGPDPITIVVPTIEIFNDGGKNKDGSVTIDGGGKVTLSGNGDHRVIYQNTCDQKLHWTSPTCQKQATPHFVMQNIGVIGGKGTASANLLGGGAVFVGGGTAKFFNVRFANNTQPNLGQDYAGGAIYTFNQATAPVYVVSSTFDGNSGSNGGALGSISTSYVILNSVFSNNVTLGNGMNPAKPNTPGGGLGGAIYNDGNSYTLALCGDDVKQNTAAELGSGSIFFVANDLKGDLKIEQSTFTGNSNKGSVQSNTHPSIYVEARDKAGNAGVAITTTTFQ